MPIQVSIFFFISCLRIAAISEPAADPKISLIADKAAQIPLKLPQKVSAEQILAIKPDLVIV